ncbi:hypothetical protein PROVRUST_06135 [Providencia rustigianii DSM 4541]|uniref:Uncharacterized protein n=1 Tax=Providencia rustigianii DSM 4541 TaxID=500637 RepID=D1P1R3_9GAMM|nr:hypothetical protein PROVRUST_06135 [Providencia rustigianii DSM 4541]
MEVTPTEGRKSGNEQSGNRISAGFLFPLGQFTHQRMHFDGKLIDGVVVRIT